MRRTETKTSRSSSQEGAKLPFARTGFAGFCRKPLERLGARRLAVIAYQAQRIRELEREVHELHLRVAVPHDRKARRRLERTVRKAVLRAAVRSRRDV